MRRRARRSAGGDGRSRGPTSRSVGWPPNWRRSTLRWQMEAERNRGPAVRLDLFDKRIGLDRGRTRPVEMLWYVCKVLFFLSAIPWPGALKRHLLRLFGASIGKG